MGFFDTLFGKKPTSQVQSQVQNGPPIQQPLPQKQENSWIYELIVEYLTSPIWKITISQFLDDHCLVFDGEEENKIEYIGIHKKFKKMMEGLVDGMLQELMIDEQSFMEQVEKGLKHEKHKKIFEQLLIIDNFLVFKMMMVKRNKELELEALKELQKQDIQRNVNVQANADQIKQLELQKEKAEIDHAIALSKAVEEERKRLLQKEQDDFNLAIMQSQAEYQAMLKQQEEELKRKMKMEELRQQKELAEQRMRDNLQNNKVLIQPKEQPNYIVDLYQPQQQQQQPQVIQQIQHKDDTPTPIQMSNNLEQEQKPSMLGVYGQPLQIHQFPEVQQATEVKQQQVQEIKPQQISEIKPQAPLGKHLPPIKPNIVQAESHIVFEEDEDQKQKDEEIRRKQIEMLKSQKSGDVQEESLEERKKRFMIQREQLRKKKQDEREKELNQYKEQQQVPDTQVKSENDPQKQSFDLQRKNTQEELQRRKEQLEQKRKQLLLQKQQQKQEDYEVDLL